MRCFAKRLVDEKSASLEFEIGAQSACCLRTLHDQEAMQGKPESLTEADALRNLKLTEKLEEAERRSEVAKKQFGKFRDVCISAQQVTLISFSWKVLDCRLPIPY